MKIKAENQSGWLIVERPKQIQLYEPQKKGILSIIFRYFTLWAPLVLLAPKMMEDSSWFIIYLFTGLPIGILASSREIIPTFFVNKKKCGFGTAHQFKPENCVILTHEERSNEIHIADTKKGISAIVWSADSVENYEKIMKALKQYIHSEGTLRADPVGGDQ
ncbi:MAG: hypothetical protein CML13_13755 [Puniceicoccaceae bacterium]|nr:hypothetical protein [Puniceicoccaceae bacterium]|tara:strand:- start:94 stop:579 length:486 start_codon:yes stop_codon:yes gene_type:complete